MEVGLDPGDFVFDGEPPPPEKKAQPTPPNFWSNGWMDEHATWYGSTPWPRPYCARWGPSYPREMGAAVPPLFGPCLLWPQSPISATTKLLLELVKPDASYLVRKLSMSCTGQDIVENLQVGMV